MNQNLSLCALGRGWWCKDSKPFSRILSITRLHKFQNLATSHCLNWGSHGHSVHCPRLKERLLGKLRQRNEVGENFNQLASKPQCGYPLGCPLIFLSCRDLIYLCRNRRDATYNHRRDPTKALFPSSLDYIRASSHRAPHLSAVSWGRTKPLTHCWLLLSQSRRFQKTLTGRGINNRG